VGRNFNLPGIVTTLEGSRSMTLALQTFVILPKEKNTVWVKQNVNFFQQNGSVIKIEQN
jgi:hypothetical protein